MQPHKAAVLLPVQGRQPFLVVITSNDRAQAIVMTVQAPERHAGRSKSTTALSTTGFE